MKAMWASDIKDNPYNFVMFSFPWGERGTPLEHHPGPRSWQKEALLEIGRHIQENKLRVRKKEKPKIFQMAIASGRGIGKSSLVAWLNLWMMSTRPGSTAINTANTEAQLLSRTWAELGKWHTLAINNFWFDRTALSLRPAPWFETALKNQLKVDCGYYYAQAQLWSEEKPDAFAGVHNHNGVLLIYDEASGIPKPIWTVSKGFFTEPTEDRYWFAFSNPRRNTGAFFECFNAEREYWHRRNIDSRSVEGTDVDFLNQIVAQHGEDSDEARVEVKGEFPRQGDKQFISREIIDGAKDREIFNDQHAALIMGVDPARYGDDSTVIRFRQGRDARSIPPITLKGADNMRVANECANLISKYNPDAVCIDGGSGAGIIDRLKEMGYKVHEVGFGTASDQQEWANKRTELWALMRDWLGGGCIDSHQELMSDLAGPEYRFTKQDRIMLEPKEEMKRRGLASPDHGDALACTFAVKVARHDLRTAKSNPGQGRVAKDVDYPIFG